MLYQLRQLKNTISRPKVVNIKLYPIKI